MEEIILLFMGFIFGFLACHFMNRWLTKKFCFERKVDCDCDCANS